MNKLIYYNNKKIHFGNVIPENTHNQDIVNLNELSKNKFKKIIHFFLSESNAKDLFIVSKNTQNAFDKLRKEFYFIEAAGGLIQNDDSYLFIKRLGKWDLPKGKLDEDETPELAAVRECEEECAVKNLTILKVLPTTYHIYAFRGSFALKVTYWFHMRTRSKEPLIPQTEESIEDVRWMDLEEIKKIVLTDTYKSISDLVKDFFNL